MAIPTNYEQSKQWLDVVNVGNKTIGAFEPCYLYVGTTLLNEFSKSTISDMKVTRSAGPSSVTQLVVNSPMDIEPLGRGRVTRDWPVIAKVTDEASFDKLITSPIYPGDGKFERHKRIWPEGSKPFAPYAAYWAISNSELDDASLAFVTETVLVADSSLNIISAISEWFKPTADFSPVKFKQFPVEVETNPTANLVDSSFELKAPGSWDIFLTVKIKAKYLGPNPVSNVPKLTIYFAIDPFGEGETAAYVRGDERLHMFPVTALLPSDTYVSGNMQIGDIVDVYGATLFADTRGLEEIYKSKISCSVVPSHSAVEVEMAVRALVVYRGLSFPG